MIRTAEPNDLEALRLLFRGGNDTPYDLARVAEEKCFGDGIAGTPVTRVFERDHHLLGAAVTCGRYLRILAVDRASRRKRIGSELLRDAEKHGAMVIAAEPGNYFTPGVPESDRAASAFFGANGYRETRSAWNLEVDLTSFPDEAVIRPSHHDADRVLAFVEREFGRAWRFEASRAFEHEQPTIFISEEDGEIGAFCAHDTNNRGLGFFGPTGVAASMRSRGIGSRLARASLADLRRLGHSRAIIPWTDAIDYYRKCCNAEPAHRFVAFEKARS